MNPEHLYLTDCEISGEARVVDMPNGCREVFGGPNKNSYPLKNGKRWHRLVYEEMHGPIPAGMVIRHTCDNARCINPAHLVIGTHSDNVRDRVSRGRSACGTRNGRAKLTEAQVKEIFLAQSSGVKAADLAKKNGVDAAVIRSIWRQKVWRKVTEALEGVVQNSATHSIPCGSRTSGMVDVNSLSNNDLVHYARVESNHHQQIRSPLNS